MNDDNSSISFDLQFDPPIPVFQPRQWNKLKDKLQGKFREHHRATNTKAVKSIEGSTREDRQCLATCCIWDGSASSAEFWHLLNTSYHCAGRGSEVSLASPEDHSVKDVNESVDPSTQNAYDTIQETIQSRLPNSLQDKLNRAFKSCFQPNQQANAETICLALSNAMKTWSQKPFDN